MSPFVSLIVPVLNVEPYLDDCFNSIAAQDYDNFEVIVVLGKSEDKSEEICNSWIKKDSRFRIEPQLKHSLGYARNVGIKAAKGEYVAFCDSDDCITTDFLSSFVDAALCEDADIVEAQFTFCSENMEPTGTYDMLPWGEKLGHDFLEVSAAPSAWKYFVKKSIFLDNQLFYPEIRFGEDIGLYSLLFSCCKKIAYVNKPLYLYRYSPKSLSNNPQGRKARYESFFEIIEFISDNARRLGILESNWPKFLFQLENHISDNIRANIDDTAQIHEAQSKLSDALKKGFPTSSTIFEHNVFGWGDNLIYYIAGRINTVNQHQVNVAKNRYFFELLGDEKIYDPGSSDLVIFDLTSEAQFLSTYNGDIGMYIRNWKLGIEKFFDDLNGFSKLRKIVVFENYCPLEKGYKNEVFINEVLKALYADIRANHPEAYFIPAAPDATLTDPDIMNVWQFRQLMTLVHTIKAPKMNIVEIKGGLGNQLFQYTFSKYIEQLTDEMPLLWNGFYDYCKDMGGTIREYSLDKFGISAPVISGRFDYKYLVEEEQFSEERAKENVFFSGYWQNKKYFEKVKDLIIQEITPKKELVSPNVNDLAVYIQNTPDSVALHIRRQDYLNQLNLDVFSHLSDDYYMKAINLIKEAHPTPEIFIFSDDPDYAITFSQSLTVPAKVIQPHRDFEDLYLMSLTTHHIIANSTYSLWGAYLASKEGITIAPSFWFKDIPAQNLYLNNWIILK